MSGPQPAPIDLLRGLPTFAGLEDEQLERVSRIATMEEIAANHELLREGGPAKDLHIVVSGKFSLCINVGSGADRCILTVSRGEVLGWSALLDQPTWLASATAIKQSSVVAIHGPSLLALCEADHELGYHVMRNLFAAATARLQDTRMQLLDMYGHG